MLRAESVRLQWVLFTSDNSFFGKKLSDVNKTWAEVWAIREPRREVWPKENTKNRFCKSDKSKSIVNIFSDNQVLWNILPWNFSCLNFLITTPVRAIQLQALKSHQIFCWATHHSRLSRQLNVEQQSHCMSFFGSFSFSPNEVCFMRNFQKLFLYILKQPTTT